MGGAAGRGVPSAAGMGGSESSHGGRKVSFGLDEREQVRVLQGIRVRRGREMEAPGAGSRAEEGPAGVVGQGKGSRGCGAGLEGSEWGKPARKKGDKAVRLKG